MRSTGPNEIQFELQEIQLTRLTFIRQKTSTKVTFGNFGTTFFY